MKSVPVFQKCFILHKFLIYANQLGEIETNMQIANRKSTSIYSLDLLRRVFSTK